MRNHDGRLKSLERQRTQAHGYEEIPVIELEPGQDWREVRRYPPIVILQPGALETLSSGKH